MCCYLQYNFLQILFKFSFKVAKVVETLLPGGLLALQLKNVCSTSACRNNLNWFKQFVYVANNLQFFSYSNIPDTKFIDNHID